MARFLHVLFFTLLFSTGISYGLVLPRHKISRRLHKKLSPKKVYANSIEESYLTRYELGLSRQQIKSYNQEIHKNETALHCCMLAVFIASAPLLTLLPPQLLRFPYCLNPNLYNLPRPNKKHTKNIFALEINAPMHIHETILIPIGIAKNN